MTRSRIHGKQPTNPGEKDFPFSATRVYDARDTICDRPEKPATNFKNPMTAMKQRTAPNSLAERAGLALGRAWRNLDRRAASALAATGLPAGAAKALLWGMRLIVLAGLLYVAFWLALLLVFTIVVTRMARNTDWEMPEPSLKWKEPEWREGLEGYGLYTYDEFRIDPDLYDND
jgi:hypothetical protein